MELSRRQFGLLAGAVAAAPLLTGRPAFAAAPTLLPPGQSWQLMWSPSARTDGMRAWESIEDDRADSHTSAAPHIFPEGDNFRFTMHTVDRDTSTDRQRHEVTGNRTPSGFLQWRTGELWRVTYSMFIPSTLKATTTFTHIFQTKMPGTGTGPITVTSLRRSGGTQTIEHKIFEPNILVGRTNLEPLHDKWIDIDYEIRIGDGSAGAVRWVLRDGATTVVDATRTGIDTFLGDRVRPKWGIYRSLGDSSGSLQNCHLLLTNLRSYKAVAGNGGGTTRYEAEAATISQGAVESNHAGHSGTGFVNSDNVAGCYTEWTVTGTAGAATLGVRFANGTTADRPATITVNGSPITQNFPGTGTWTGWTTATLPVTLNAGANTVRITANTANGNPNLDYLEVTQ
ncbi:CBM35 domain-containing protein [Nonomuraea longicatena]|uniref:CBM6 domain-containing protein n=1 Tax=Nonomuraea longicatena TaxID=83682 RepID=A0ABN1R374_9ACTN